jgi:UDP-3-O-[3-hydroxymyristoyl] glucosamine N-acyltransferase/acyl carrier protein
LAIGSRVRIGHGAAITAHQDIQIADDVRLAAFVMIMDTDFHDVGAHGREGRTAPIRIERGVHIGAHVTILRGTTIGEGARVEAGSVVSGLVASGEHVAGVPARPAGDDAARAVDPQDPFAVSEVIRSTLGLAAAPGPDERLDELPGLDSLGLLNVLLSLEDRCGVSLSHKQILAARRVGHVIALVQQAPRSVVVTQ